MANPMSSGQYLPAPGEGKRGEEGYLGYLLRQAAGASRLRLERALADIGVTAPQFLVLTMIKAYPKASGADLARITQLTPQTVSVIIANLRKTGALVSRKHAVHGRIVELDLSDHGEELLAQARQRAHGLEAEMAAGLTAEEAQVVRRWLAGLARV